MKVYHTNEIKNISILGSSGSGKTTLAEAMLYEGGTSLSWEVRALGKPLSLKQCFTRVEL